VLGSRILGGAHRSQPLLSVLSDIGVSYAGYKSSTG
jgi:hypothetical protein